MPKNAVKLFVSNIAGRQDSEAKDLCKIARWDNAMKIWDWVKLHHKDCQFVIHRYALTLHTNHSWRVNHSWRELSPSGAHLIIWTPGIIPTQQDAA